MESSSSNTTNIPHETIIKNQAELLTVYETVIENQAGLLAVYEATMVNHVTIMTVFETVKMKQTEIITAFEKLYQHIAEEEDIYIESMKDISAHLLNPGLSYEVEVNLLQKKELYRAFFEKAQRRFQKEFERIDSIETGTNTLIMLLYKEEQRINSLLTSPNTPKELKLYLSNYLEQLEQDAQSHLQKTINRITQSVFLPQQQRL